MNNLANNILKRITEKKQRFDKLKPLHKDLEKNLYNWTRIALTYTSNAIEGNTLSHQDTALVVEENLTIGGKTVTEHLEAINHAQAIDLITPVQRKTPHRTYDRRHFSHSQVHTQEYR